MAELAVTYLLCVAVLVVCIVAANLQKENHIRTTRTFSYLAYAVGMFNLACLLSDILDGHPEYTLTLYVINLMTFILIDIVIATFTVYFNSLLEERGNKNKYIEPLVMLACSARIIITLIIAFTGHLFTIENGYYVDGDMSAITYVIPVIIICSIMYVAIKNRKYFELREFVVILIYLMIPLISTIVEALTELYSLTCAALTLSVLLMYVIIQSRLIEEGKTRETALEEISNTDFLTKLANRRAYYNCISSIAADDNVGVVFCDINRLKYVNDHYGHTAGDDLIKEFAGIINGFFKDNYVFRISGDEFVAITTGMSRENFLKKAKEFKAVVANNNNIAAVGASYGIGSRLEYLLADSEDKMYADKGDRRR